MPLTALQPCFVLVRPQMAENIGAAARAMWNFELDDMRVVAARDGWPSKKAIAMASGAGRLLEEARHFNDLESAIGDCHFTFATTARVRSLEKPVYSPEEAIQLVFEKINFGHKVSILFGPERAGLENKEIVKANAFISVPVNPKFPSLNLAQCILILSYEWRRISIVENVSRAKLCKTEWATKEEVNRLSVHYEDCLEQAGYFFPQTKAAGMKVSLRNMWSRLPLTRVDIQIFHGMLRQMVRWKEKGP